MTPRDLAEKVLAGHWPNFDEWFDYVVPLIAKAKAEWEEQAPPSVRLRSALERIASFQPGKSAETWQDDLYGLRDIAREALKNLGDLKVWPVNAPKPMTWDEATQWCASLGEGWRLPTKEELHQLYLNRDELGGFGDGWFWSSSKYSNNGGYAWSVRFSDGNQGYYDKSNQVSVRAVRALSDPKPEAHRAIAREALEGE